MKPFGNGFSKLIILESRLCILFLMTGRVALTSTKGVKSRGLVRLKLGPGKIGIADFNRLSFENDEIIKEANDVEF